MFVRFFVLSTNGLVLKSVTDLCMREKQNKKNIENNWLKICIYQK